MPSPSRAISPGIARGLAAAVGIPSELVLPAGERAVRAMMALKQARDAGGGAVRRHHVTEAQRHIAGLDPARHGALMRHLQACVVAMGGRGGDTHIAHVTPGEVVVPNRLQTPAFQAALRQLARAHGIDPDQLRVASDRNAINPYTGQMEFDDEEDANTNNSYFPGNAYSSPPNNLPGRWISPYNSPEQRNAMQQPPLSIFDKIGMGVGDKIYGGAQSYINGSGLLDPSDALTAQQLNKDVVQRDVDYRARRDAVGESGSDNWRKVGNAIASLPVAAASAPIEGALAVGALGKTAVPIISSAAQSLLEPVANDGNFWTSKAEQAATDVIDDLSKDKVLQWIKDKFR